MRLPPELDRLMWAIAEEDSIAARGEFLARHPEYAEVLERRIDELRAKRERGETGSGKRPELRASRPPRALPVWVAVLAGLAVGGLLVALAIPRRREVTSPAIPPLVRAETSRGVAFAAPIAPPVTEAPSSAPAAIPAAIPVPLSERTTTMTLARTDLRSALALVAAAGRISLRADPNLPNPEVETVLENMTPRAMIDTLGARYGFAVIEETPDSLVVVPLPEPLDAGEKAPSGAKMEQNP